MEHSDLIVVGAGQAGLATAHAARRSGLTATILEASDLPAGSWPTYYDSLRLFSPARYSSLPGRPFPGDPERYPARDEVVDYLVSYADWLDADIRTGQRVERVEIDAGRFVAQTTAGQVIQAPRLIAATGGFGSPHRPAIPGMEDFAGEVLHSSYYRSPDPFAGRRVLVVGAGNSAVQIAAELAERARVTLATRSPVRWFPQRPLGRDIHWWLTKTGLDNAPLGPRLGARTAPVLDEGRYRAAVESGRPDHRQMFTAFDGAGVRWADGEAEPVDAVILATGFRPHLPFLEGTGALDGAGEPRHCRGVSTTVEGLGYVGLSFQRSFASATIRGVGRDAAYVLPRLAPDAQAARRGSRPSCCRAAAAT